MGEFFRVFPSEKGDIISILTSNKDDPYVSLKVYEKGINLEGYKKRDPIPSLSQETNGTSNEKLWLVIYEKK